MSDIALTWDPKKLAGDFAVSANDIVTDAGLRTALLLSLFTDRQAEPTDVLPNNSGDRRGWWADPTFGSRLWLLQRSKQTPDVPSRAEEYSREATQWLTDTKVTERIDVTSDFLDDGSGYFVEVSVKRPNVDPVKFRFDRVWAAEEARV